MVLHHDPCRGCDVLARAVVTVRLVAWSPCVAQSACRYAMKVTLLCAASRAQSGAWRPLWGEGQDGGGKEKRRKGEWVKEEISIGAETGRKTQEMKWKVRGSQFEWCTSDRGERRAERGEEGEDGAASTRQGTIFTMATVTGPFPCCCINTDHPLPSLLLQTVFTRTQRTLISTLLCHQRLVFLLILVHLTFIEYLHSYSCLCAFKRLMSAPLYATWNPHKPFK